MTTQPDKSLWRVHNLDHGTSYQAEEGGVKAGYVKDKIRGANVVLQRATVNWETVPLSLERED